MSKSIIEFRKEFPYEKDRIHLNNAGIAPTMNSVRKKIDYCLELASQGYHQIDRNLEVLEESRASLGRFLNIPSGQLAFFPSTSTAISQVAMGFPFNSGDEIITWDQEYSSNAYPWFAAQKKWGVRVKVIKSENNFNVKTERLIEAMTNRTRMIAVSWVQWQTGSMTDLDLLSKECRVREILLGVDAIQGLGVIPFDFQTSGVDIVFGGAHKWMCCPVGLGFMGIREDLIQKLNPIYEGAFTYGAPGDPVDLDLLPKSTAHRFEPGAPPILMAAALGESAEILAKTGIKNVYKQAIAISDEIKKRVEKNNGIVFETRPVGAAGIRSPIITYQAAHGLDPERIRLTKNHISFNERVGGIRLSPHGFNQLSDVDRIFKD